MEVVKQAGVKTTESITRLQASFDAMLVDFKRELQSDHVEVAEKAAKKAKLDRPQVFKSKGNEDQYVFNDKVVDVFQSGESQLSKIDRVAKDALSTSLGAGGLAEPVAKLKDSMAEGMDLLAKRQKHIKLADRSDFG